MNKLYNCKYIDEIKFHHKYAYKKDKLILPSKESTKKRKTKKIYKN